MHYNGSYRLGQTEARHRPGHRVSMIRRYVNGVERLMEQQVDSWISAENANLAADQQTYLRQ